MEPPKQPVTFTPEQASELDCKLSEARHNINNYLALIVSAAELIRRQPALAVKMTETQAEQTKKIEEEIQKFSAEFERSFSGSS